MTWPWPVALLSFNVACYRCLFRKNKDRLGADGRRLVGDEAGMMDAVHVVHVHNTANYVTVQLSEGGRGSLPV